MIGWELAPTLQHICYNTKGDIGMEEQNMDILERIHASYYQLTATERKVADYVLAQHAQV